MRPEPDARHPPAHVEDYIRNVVEALPPITQPQRSRMADILRAPSAAANKRKDPAA